MPPWASDQEYGQRKVLTRPLGHGPALSGCSGGVAPAVLLRLLDGAAALYSQRQLQNPPAPGYPPFLKGPGLTLCHVAQASS